MLLKRYYNLGSYGPETVTLQNSKVNAGFTYAIGIHDFKNELNGFTSASRFTNNPNIAMHAFGFSQAKIEVTNGTTTYTETLPLGSLPSAR